MKESRENDLILQVHTLKQEVARLKEQVPEHAWLRRCKNGWAVQDGTTSIGMASGFSGAAGHNATEEEQFEAGLEYLRRALR